MITPKILGDLVGILEDEKIHYWVFGGIAMDALRGRITRSHKDIDIYVVSTDCRKFLKALSLNKYDCVRQGNKYSAKKDGSCVEIVKLVRRENVFAAYSNRKITYYPKEIFRKHSRTRIWGVTFDIAPNEVLVFKSGFASHESDKRFGLKLRHDKSLEKKISYRKIKKDF